jgi:hypothetical protein
MTATRYPVPVWQSQPGRCERCGQAATHVTPGLPCLTCRRCVVCAETIMPASDQVCVLCLDRRIAQVTDRDMMTRRERLADDLATQLNDALNAGLLDGFPRKDYATAVLWKLSNWRWTTNDLKAATRLLTQAYPFTEEED